MMKTKKNHFVPKNYLRSFSYHDNKTSKDVLYVKDLEKNKARLDAIDNVGLRKHLYTLTKAIQDSDIEFMKLLYPNDTPFTDIDEYILQLLKVWLNEDYHEYLKVSIENPTIASIINKYYPVNCIYLKNYKAPDKTDKLWNQESLYTFYENRYWKVYEKICSGDLSFYKKYEWEDFWRTQRAETLMFLNISILSKILKLKNEDISDRFSDIDAGGNEYFDLILFVVSQMLRIEKIKNQVMNELNSNNEVIKYLNKNNVDLENLFILNNHFTLFNIAESLIEQEFFPVLLENKTNRDFITSDVPVFNLALVTGGRREFFYPISTKRALILTNNSFVYSSCQIIKVESEKDIFSYNKLIKSMSNRFIYAKNKDNFLNL